MWWLENTPKLNTRCMITSHNSCINFVSNRSQILNLRSKTDLLAWKVNLDSCQFLKFFSVFRTQWDVEIPVYRQWDLFRTNRASFNSITILNSIYLQILKLTCSNGMSMKIILRILEIESPCQIFSIFYSCARLHIK